MGLYNRGGLLIGGSVIVQATEPSGADYGAGSVWIDSDNGQIFTNISSDFIQQTPGALGTGLQVLRVNAGATALEYATLATAATPRFLFGCGFNISETANSVIFYNPVTYMASGGTIIEANADIDIPFGFQVNSVTIYVSANNKNGTTTFGFRDDGTTIGSTSITATTTGELQTTGLTTNVASGSQCAFVIDTSASASGGITPQVMHCGASIV